MFGATIAQRIRIRSRNADPLWVSLIVPGRVVGVLGAPLRARKFNYLLPTDTLITQRSVVQIHPPRNQNSFHFFSLQPPVKTVVASCIFFIGGLLHWGSAGASAQSTETCNCMKDWVLVFRMARPDPWGLRTTMLHMCLREIGES